MKNADAIDELCDKIITDAVMMRSAIFLDNEELFLGRHLCKLKAITRKKCAPASRSAL